MSPYISYQLMFHSSPKTSAFQRFGVGSSEERDILLSNLLTVKKYNLMFLCHSQRDASTRQANHLQNYREELVLSYVHIEQHSKHLHMVGFITQERLL